MALHSAGDGVAGQILAEFGAGEQRTREALAQLLSGQAPELAERIRHRLARR